MKTGSARLIARALAGILPAAHGDWARAMAAEIDAIADDREALAFACGCLRAACVVALAPRTLARAPGRLGLVCGGAAAALGALFMATAGAPDRYVAMHLSSLLLGIAGYALIRRRRSGVGADVLVFAGGLCLLAPVLLGRPLDGVARWLQLGPVMLQPGPLLLPPLMLGFARRPTRLASLGIGLAAFALALQPDRLLAAVLVAGLASLARRERAALRLLPIALAGLAFALCRTVEVTAAPFVDAVVTMAFGMHPGLGLVMGCGLALLLGPALVASVGPAPHASLRLFAVVWLPIVLAALCGLHPAPLIGFGGSAVVGYFLSLALLPRGLDAPRPRSG